MSHPSLERDSHGVFHIHGQSIEDVIFGMGKVHATDRALSMHLMRVFGQGRLTELLNDDEHFLEVDKLFRAYGFANDLSKEEAKLSPGARALLETYCAGVNEVFVSHLPWELKLAGLKNVSPWSPQDVLLFARLIAFVGLAESTGEAERLIIQLIKSGLSGDFLEELFPDRGLKAISEELLQAIQKAEWHKDLLKSLERLPISTPSFRSSNNWVLSGKKTRSGKPIFANDPHTEANRLPAIWHESVWRTSDAWYCFATTLPGVPLPIIARTPHTAWGPTYSFADTMDTWIERVRGDNYEIRKNGQSQWLPLKKRKEIFHRKKHGPMEHIFYETHHGILDGSPPKDGYAVSTECSVVRGMGAASMDAAMDLLKSKNSQSALNALARFEPSMSWAVADHEGNIGFQMSGRIPKREGHLGLAPLCGWDPKDDWKGFLAPDDLPRTLNPEEGYFCTANNDLNRHGPTKPTTIAMGNARRDQIAETLAARHDWDVESVSQLQNDTFCRHAEKFLKILRPLLKDSTRAIDKILLNWDGRYETQSLGPSVFEAFLENLRLGVFGRILGHESARELVQDTRIFAVFFDSFDQILLKENSLWFNNIPREEHYQNALQGLASLQPVPWGETSQITFHHLLLGHAFPKLCRTLGLSHGPHPLKGSRASVHQGQTVKVYGREVTVGPAIRFITDFSEAAVHSVIAGGPSDRRFSPWYVKDLMLWLRGETKKISLS